MSAQLSVRRHQLPANRRLRALLIMAVLIAAVVLVGLLGLVNLVFCIGIVRRLREHTELLNRQDRVMASQASDFTATTVEGNPLSRQSLSAGTLVGFVTTTCPACADRLPEFVAYAENHRGPVLAVVIGPAPDAAAMIDAVSGVAQVVHESTDGAVAKAFGVQAFPAFGLLADGGVVRASGSVTKALANA